MHELLHRRHSKEPRSSFPLAGALGRGELLNMPRRFCCNRDGYVYHALNRAVGRVVLRKACNLQAAVRP